MFDESRDIYGNSDQTFFSIKVGEKRIILVHTVGMVLLINQMPITQISEEKCYKFNKLRIHQSHFGLFAKKKKKKASSKINAFSPNSERVKK